MDPLISPQVAVDPLGPFAARLEGRTTGQDPASIRKAAQEFEGFFISYLLKTMRETVHAGLLKNEAGQMFHSFYDEELGRRAAQAGGLGLGAMVETYIRQQNAITVPSGLKFSDTPTDTTTGTGETQEPTHLLPTDAHQGRN
ncbi:hypothetical protein W02_19310 [Nitrospira sp. KM1]|uniref:rod-binding protein n=1 Tax=Nitrospira sp. KM1 TaxID=1936990 RepID=UPI0013A74E1C|nr:rod-binding protein [Nitrospira sp. KM1]BCA54791.1 hypothetical protein W02_19310 [Nitrospira sp. KM1]